MKKKKFNIGTTITAISLGILLGIFISGLFRLPTLIIIMRIILIPTLAIIFVFWGYKSPRTLEITAYAAAIFLLSQAMWDWYAHDWNQLRTEIAIPAITSIIFNMVSGEVRVIGAKKTFRAQLGLSQR